MRYSRVIPAAAFLLLTSSASSAFAQTATFEDLTLPGPESFWNGSDGTGGFTSGGAFFNNTFTDFGDFTAWEGWSFSNVTDVTTPGVGNQFSAFNLPSGGGDQSSQYGVAFTFEPGTARIELPPGTFPVSARITNTTFAALSMRDGDAFAKQFGGPSGNDPDWFKLTISGLDPLDTPIGAVDFYLADFRFDDNSLDFIVDEFTTVDLTSLAGASTLSFGLLSTDVGTFGINTPAYFALDNLTVSSTAIPEPASWLLVALGGLALIGYRSIVKRHGRPYGAFALSRSRLSSVLAVSFMLGGVPGIVHAGPFPGAAGTPGSDAISKDSPRFVRWATGFRDLVRGPQDISNGAFPLASFGTGTNALGPATGSPADVVSLGDGGQITLTFDRAIFDGPGADFAVFENGFAFGSSQFLELAHVEVSSNGIDFFRFPSISLTPTDSQVGAFDPLEASDLLNLAGKYVAGFGTPFDLADLAPDPLLDTNRVGFVRLLDVVGSIDENFGTFDSLGNLINDPFPTPFASSGFDLEAVGVIHAVPEPASLALWLLGTVAAIHLRFGTRRRHSSEWASG